MTVGLTSIRTTNDKIEIVNQLLLPHTTEFVPIDTIDDAYDAIKSMKVRTSRQWNENLKLMDSFEYADSRRTRNRLSSCALRIVLFDQSIADITRTRVLG